MKGFLRYEFGGPVTFGGTYTFSEFYVFFSGHLTLLSVQRQQSGGTGGLKLLLRVTLQHTSSFVIKTFRVLSQYVSLCMNVLSQTEILLL